MSDVNAADLGDMEVAYSEYANRIWGGRHFASCREFDRAIAKVEADALREAAAELRGMEDEGPYVTLSEQVKDGWGIDCGEIDQGYADWLRVRADRIEAGEA